MDPSALDRKKKTDFLVEFPTILRLEVMSILDLQDAQTH